MGNINEISGLINQLKEDLKAEMIVATLADELFESKSIISSFNGQLKRGWSKDMSFCEPGKLSNGDEVLFVHLNRDGIYDTLPEAIFHSSPENVANTGEEMAKESMRLKKEEKDSRSFFQPLENEIFSQRVRLASTENKLLSQIHTSSLMGIIPDFWNIPGKLPQQYVSKLLKFIPLANKITGNLQLTAQCLEFIINEKVTVSISYEKRDHASNSQSDSTCILGTTKLGIDSISGDYVSGFFHSLIFDIGPVLNPETDKLIKNGKLNSFLNCFYGYFVPLEADVETKFTFENKRSRFVLDNGPGNDVSYLGLNSVID